MKNRKSSIERKTLETNIAVEIDLDGSGVSLFDTGLPFFRAYVGSDCSSWND